MVIYGSVVCGAQQGEVAQLSGMQWQVVPLKSGENVAKHGFSGFVGHAIDFAETGFHAKEERGGHFVITQTMQVEAASADRNRHAAERARRRSPRAGKNS